MEAAGLADTARTQLLECSLSEAETKEDNSGKDAKGMSSRKELNWIQYLLKSLESSCPTVFEMGLRPGAASSSAVLTVCMKDLSRSLRWKLVVSLACLFSSI